MMNLNEIVDSMKDDIIKSTQEIIRIKSVQEGAMEGMPFGEGVHKAYEYAMKLSKDLGFEVKDIDGYAGHADMGDGEESLGILVHLDVVPEGDNWTYPPYAAEIHDNKIFGRGTIDDKGPAIACLYAMKAVRDSGVKLNKKVRIIYGLNEESGWECMKHYLKKEKPTTLAFTPDADFPAIHGEKGIMIFDLVRGFTSAFEGEGIRVLAIKGGNRPNMVPDYCEAHVASDTSLAHTLKAYKETHDVAIEVQEKEDKAIIKSFGVSSHGSLPDHGINAVSQLMMFLNTLELAKGEVTDFIKFYCEKIGMEYYGQSIGCGLSDAESGKLIFNVGIIDLNESKVVVAVNIRYPITNTVEEVYEGIKNQIDGTGIGIIETDHKKPIYLPKDHVLVQKLMKVYRDFTGDNSEPITIGGGTYARAMDNAVAFGPLFPGQPELAHQKDEFIAIEDLVKITKIYANAIYELAK